MPAKVVHTSFPLTTVAGRVALLTCVISGDVSNRALKEIVVHDTEKRPYRKPVVAAGKRYSSITEAAEGICGKMAPRRRILAMQKMIANYCNADNVPHYYWSE